MKPICMTVLMSVACASALWLAAPAVAADNNDGGMPLTNRASDTLYELMGVPIVNFRVAAGGITAINRCGIVQRRMEPLMATPLSRSDVTVSSKGGESQILVRGHLVFTACSEDARANNSTTVGLANEWAAHLRTAIGMLGY
ncbi:MAG: hypothetical protein HZB16_07195 [Armatimonadetes bacterium]|nr:hypothetical protein [Armatimonadota bacterium]